MAKSKKQIELEQQIGELTEDLQRTRADFENYRKRTEQEKAMVRHDGASQATAQLLPVIDIIEQATRHVPADLAENSWAKGVIGLTKNLDKALLKIGVVRIEAAPGTVFDPEFHEAIQMDDEAEGEKEVIAEELRAGYTLNGRPLRHAMVKVTRSS